MAVPIGIKAKVGKQIKFSIEKINLPKDIKSFLEDKVINIFVEINHKTDYYSINVIKNLEGIGRLFYTLLQNF